MWINMKKGDFSAKYIGIKMFFYYKDVFQCELEVATYGRAIGLLEDWARLKRPPSQVLLYQDLMRNFGDAIWSDPDVDFKNNSVYKYEGKSLINYQKI